MSDDLKYQCKRRPHPIMEAIVWRKETLGAGSGGDEGDGGHTDYYDGMYCINAPDVTVTATGSVGEDAASPIIQLCSGTGTAPDGRIYVHGSQGVRITSGPSGQPHCGNPDINGLEMHVGGAQEIIVRRGDPVEQTIQISPGLMAVNSPSLISIVSDEQIELSVAGGTSSIILSPSGIVLKGPIIQIN
jgi:hypothetical protein